MACWLGASELAALADMAAPAPPRQRLQGRIVQSGRAAPLGYELGCGESQACLVRMPADLQEPLAVVHELEQFGHFEHSAPSVLVPRFG